MSAADFSAVHLCNRAFDAAEHNGLLGDFGDGSPEAAMAARHWDMARRHVLAAAPWGFATAFGSASAAIVAPTPAATPYAVALAPDCLFFRSLCDLPGCVAIPFGDRLLRTDAAPPFVYEYTADVVEPFRFAPAFAEALTLYLAHLFAPRLSRSSTLAERLLQRYQLALDDAAVTDARAVGLIDQRDAAGLWTTAGQAQP